jgi:hypothetical protein
MGGRRWKHFVILLNVSVVENGVRGRGGRRGGGNLKILTFYIGQSLNRLFTKFPAF